MPSISKTVNRPVKKGVPSIQDLIQPLELDDDGLTMSIYGRSGSGKTVFACTAPKPLLLLGAEKGTKSVHNVPGIDFLRIKESGQVTQAVQYVAGGGKPTAKNLKYGQLYRSVVLDTASILQDLILKEILGLEEIPVQNSWGMASQSQYGQRSIMLKERLRELLQLSEKVKANVIIICQEMNHNEEINSDILLPSIGSALSSKLAGWLDASCDYIGQMYKMQKTATKQITLGNKVKTVETKMQGADYYLRTAPHPIFMTKFRAPKGMELPESIKDPTFDKVYNLIQGGT